MAKSKTKALKAKDSDNGVKGKGENVFWKKENKEEK